MLSPQIHHIPFVISICLPGESAVLPLKNLLGDSTQEYLADGMPEALISLDALPGSMICASFSHFGNALQEYTTHGARNCQDARCRCDRRRVDSPRGSSGPRPCPIDSCRD
jgi:hypothetical protein